MGRKLFGAIHYVVPYALSIAVFPFFCDLVDRRDRDSLGRLVTHSTRLLVAPLLPFAILVAALAEPITALVFQGGHFDFLAVQRTSLSMALYTLVIPAAAVEAMLMQAFFADRRMVSAVVMGVIFSSFSILVSWIGLKLADGNAFIVLGAVAGGFTLSRTLKTVALALWLKRHVPVFPLLSTFGFLTRVSAAGLAGGLSGRWSAAWVASRWGGWEGLNTLQAGLTTVAGGLTGGLVLIAAFAILRIREPGQIACWGLRKVFGNTRVAKYLPKEDEFRTDGA